MLPIELLHVLLTNKQNLKIYVPLADWGKDTAGLKVWAPIPAEQ